MGDPAQVRHGAKATDMTGMGEVHIQVNFAGGGGETSALAAEYRGMFDIRFKAKMGGILDRGVRTMWENLQQRINLSEDGPPGVRFITGQYYRSWERGVLYRGTDHPAMYLGTNEPRARRLEYGFTGTDSLGRHYNQPPYPHAGPAFDETIPSIEAEINALIFTTLNSGKGELF